MAVMKKYEQGALIKSLDHNLTQRNGVIFSKPEYSVVSQASVYNLKDFEMEQEIFEGLKLKLLIDTDSMGDSFSIKINDSNYPVSGKFEAGNIYNLVCVKSTNDLNEDIYSFEIEKSGGGASFVTIIDQDVSISVPDRQSYNTGISVPDGDYSIINIILTFENLQPAKLGISEAYDLVKTDFSQTGFIEGGAYRCGPYETFGEQRIFAWVQNESLWLLQNYMSNMITHVKIQVI